MCRYIKSEKKILDAEQAKLKKFKISYCYTDMGSEGMPTMFPEKVIEAKTKELAVYIYQLMFFCETRESFIESNRKNGGVGIALKPFADFLTSEHKYWATSVEEIN